MNHNMSGAGRPNKTLRSIPDLIEVGLIDRENQDVIGQVEERFNIAIPPHLYNLIDATTRTDPISLQFVPHPDELQVLPTELSDPIGDGKHTPIDGIVHRYPDRLLLKAVHVCPVYCRFCFRREKVGRGGEALTPSALQSALNYILEHREVWEVVLSGGDPLILPDTKLLPLVDRLHQISHVEVIRLHTRFPVSIPQRITKETVNGLLGRAAVYMVLHCNHPRELTPQAIEACALFIDSGIPVMSQSVLLAGVNDDLTTLEQLLRKLVRNRIKPYYLHHLDLARGTNHFRTSIKQGQQLLELLRGRLSGLCQPTYVLDIPGGYGKIPIGPNYLVSQAVEGVYQVTDYEGGVHVYHDTED